MLMCFCAEDENELHAGSVVVLENNLLLVFKQFIKPQLADVFECNGGDDDFVARHWRHLDFVNEKGNQRIVYSLRDPTGARQRMRYLTEQGMTEIAMLTLYEFFQLKTVYDHDSIYVPLDATFLTLRNCQNRKLMQLLENGGDIQRYNRGVRYAVDVAIPTDSCNTFCVSCVQNGFLRS